MQIAPRLDGRNQRVEQQSERSILIVEDEPSISGFIRRGLIFEGYSVEAIDDGRAGLERLRDQRPDLLILDLMLPGIDGLEICRRVRAAEAADGSTPLPILMLTARDAINDRVTGLEAGADDYLVKPFKFQELLARIRSLLRRRGPSPPPATELLRYDDLELDVPRKEAVRNGKRIPLTVKEFALLEYLMRNPNRVLTRAMISEKVWDIAFDTGTNMVEAYVKLLRRKVDRDFGTKLIRTKVGHGYILSNGQ